MPEIDLEGEDAPVLRTYSLSNASGGDVYRISVKREPHGLVSRHQHDRMGEGAILKAGTPRGDSVLDPEAARPVMLVSAGVGVTPMVSMLHELAASGDARPVWFVHGTRDGASRALAAEVRDVVASMAAVTSVTAYSRPRADDSPGHDFDETGRVDAALIERLAPGRDVDVYLCGPAPFMAALQSGLESRGFAAERIHAESFGLAALPAARRPFDGLLLADDPRHLRSDEFCDP